MTLTFSLDSPRTNRRKKLSGFVVGFYFSRMLMMEIICYSVWIHIFFSFKLCSKRNKNFLKNSCLIALDPLFFKFCYFFFCIVTCIYILFSWWKYLYGSQYFLVWMKGALLSLLHGGNLIVRLCRNCCSIVLVCEAFLCKGVGNTWEWQWRCPGKYLECTVLHCEQCRILLMSQASFI